jgi:hypothetical protein
VTGAGILSGKGDLGHSTGDYPYFEQIGNGTRQSSVVPLLLIIAMIMARGHGWILRRAKSQGSAAASEQLLRRR